MNIINISQKRVDLFISQCPGLRSAGYRNDSKQSEALCLKLVKSLFLLLVEEVCVCMCFCLYVCIHVFVYAWMDEWRKGGKREGGTDICMYI